MILWGDTDIYHELFGQQVDILNEDEQPPTVDNFSYSVVFDKDTYLTKHIYGWMTGTQNMDGEAISVEEEVFILVDLINEIEEIKVPEQVEFSAVEIEEW
jgi:hypothetical protein